MDLSSQQLKASQNKAGKAWFSVKGSLKKLGVLPISTAIKLFDNLVKPIMLYGSEVWGLSYISSRKDMDFNQIIQDEKFDFEKLHTKFGKQTLLVHKKGK
jgi:hypothetical protein